MKKFLLLVTLLTAFVTLSATITPVVTITWTIPSSGCTTTLPCTYSVYRSLAPGTETLLKSGIVPLTYQDTSVTRGTKYYYKTSASNQYGEGPLSSEHSITVPNVPSAPGNVQVTSN